jgi:hypothetical protein
MLSGVHPSDHGRKGNIQEDGRAIDLIAGKEQI